MSDPAEERSASRFCDRFAELGSIAADRGAVEALRPEASTVLAAIVEAVGTGPLPDPRGTELREALTLASLLGRRAAHLGVTPGAALALAPAIVHALAGTIDLEPILDPLRVTVVEGYVRACEERERDRADRRAAEAIAFAKVAPHCFAIFVRGDQVAEELERRVDELGRALLEGDAKACVVDATGLVEPDRDRAAQLFAIHATCVMLGVRAIFVGVSEPWRRAAEEARIDLTPVTWAPTVTAAFEEALGWCGLELAAPPAFGKGLWRLLGGRR
ncbi:MAG: hypothetical protein H6719_02940 [Sandaracinaceae bacterium]|nr:hypothetical protein [Sandaracinaceae bacterium]